MQLSKRLKFIADKIDKCSCIADIGTDHGYIPIYAVKNNICKSAIASDINIDPLKKAKMNISYEGLSKSITVRHGGGLSPIVKGEAEAVIIAGMGGNLICDILKADIDKVKKYKFMILQPAQNPEVLREYLYNSNYEIIEEDLCKDDGIIYELFKVRWEVKSLNSDMDSIYYEVSPYILNKKNDLVKEFINEKKDKYTKIISFIKDDTESALKRKQELNSKIEKLNKLLVEM